jgi:uncharacterized protein YutE (UPF0331/DUF86 family)
VSGAARPPVAAQARRSALDDALGQLARTMEQLESAVSAFVAELEPEGGAAGRESGWSKRGCAPEARVSRLRSGPSIFDLSAFEAAWYSEVPAERNRAMLVRSNMDDLHNLCQTLIGLSVRVAQDLGAIPSDRKTPAADQLRAQGLYPKTAERVMQEVVELRNRSQHEYWILTPGDVHSAVNLQRQRLPAFIAAVGAWIEGLSG